MMTDPIADMLTRIRNAGMARLTKTTIPYSKIKLSIGQILKQEGFIEDCVLEEGAKPSITVTMKYGVAKQPAIVGIVRASRPGRRIYVKYGEIPRVQNGLGLTVLSTSRGVLSGDEAREKKLGGEILCKVW